MEHVNEYVSARIRLASRDDILSRSFGEVKSSVTINYNTYRAEMDGIFCERIFGPERDWECFCGKYKGTDYKGVICDVCGVKITHSRVRRMRHGHINLAAPIVHRWFLNSGSCPLAVLLGIKAADVRKVVDYECYVVISPGGTPLRRNQLLDEDEYRRAREAYGDQFEAEMGAHAVRKLLNAIDLEIEAERIHTEIAGTRARRKITQLTRQLTLVGAIRNSENKAEWMVMDVIGVIPPDLRPLVLLSNGNFATSDLNDLYRSIINRNNRLNKLIELNAPPNIIRNEKRELQRAVDALFDNGRCRQPVLSASDRPLKSLTDMISGEKGRFRENLLGKRVDYSASTVIVPDPALQLHQCGLPKLIALVLYQPFMFRLLMSQGLADTVKSAKEMIERCDPEVWDVLEQCMHQYPVLLNRAPTLGRTSIQAFEPVLVEGNAVKIHPLVSRGFNTSFDGDQIAVHLPLSIEAQIEAQVLLSPANNIFSAADGTVILAPSRDIVLGVYYLTVEREGDRGEYMMLPSEMPFYNIAFTSGGCNRIIIDTYARLGRAATIKLLDDIKAAGFRQSTLAGLSLGIADIPEPGTAVDVAMAEELNPLQMMAASEAGVTIEHLRQLAGIRGLTPQPGGGVQTSIKSNVRQGLPVLEYFASTHGVRKGALDQAIRTANAAHLTRRLVDAAHNIIVNARNCGTNDGVIKRTLYKGEAVEVELKDLIVGRTACDTLSGPDGRIIVQENEIITIEAADRLKEVGLESIRVRSPLTCQSPHGVCAQCYGADLSTNRLAEEGLAVGIIAAQSIGEPGMQCTLNTPRNYTSTGPIGSSTVVDIAAAIRRVSRLLEVVSPRRPAVLAKVSGTVEIRIPECQWRIVVVRSESGMERTHKIRARAELLVRDGDAVVAGTPISRGQIDPRDVLRILGEESARECLLAEVQKVYRSQDVRINDKHIEIILNRMFSKVQITDPGDGEFLPGQIVDRFHFGKSNRALSKSVRIEESGGTPCQRGDLVNQAGFDAANEAARAASLLPAQARQARPAKDRTLLLGISKVSFLSESFFSAASFHEPSRVLSEAALAGAVDRLSGLKENVILGRLIPAGTGLRKYVRLRAQKKTENAHAAVPTLGLTATGSPEERECQTPE